MKTILCNLTKAYPIFANFAESLCNLEYGDTSIKNSRNFNFLWKNYTLVYITGICSKH